MNRNGNRHTPLFPMAMRNVHNRVLNNQDRTNSHAEAAYRHLQCELQMDHPSAWQLLDGLRRIQKTRDLLYERIVAGHSPPVKRRRYREVDECIRTSVQSFTDLDIC